MFLGGRVELEALLPGRVTSCWNPRACTHKQAVRLPKAANFKDIEDLLYAGPLLKTIFSRGNHAGDYGELSSNGLPDDSRCTHRKFEWGHINGSGFARVLARRSGLCQVDSSYGCRAPA